MRTVLLCCLVLSGCASQQQPPRELTPSTAMGMNAATLCLGISTFRPGNAAVAQQEIERRGINCADHAMAVQALQQQRAQNDAQAMQLLMSRPSPQPYMLPMPVQPQQTICTTQRVGDQLQTICR
jgi:hypothetical protein